ncbi:hypothetical protein F5B21DRAFT_95817 [Xylaria acuta]|nr:hypothetical protein F5B21DRAFT_95817 [Xylaria acuta]
MDTARYSPATLNTASKTEILIHKTCDSHGYCSGPSLGHGISFHFVSSSSPFPYSTLTPFLHPSYSPPLPIASFRCIVPCPYPHQQASFPKARLRGRNTVTDLAILFLHKASHISARDKIIVGVILGGAAFIAVVALSLWRWQRQKATEKRDRKGKVVMNERLRRGSFRVGVSGGGITG